MSDGIQGHGTSLKVCANTSFTTVTTIGNIISITGLEESRDAIDISTGDSTAKWREFIPGMIDAGEVTAEINYDGTAAGTADALATLFTNAAQYWRITFDDNTTASNCSRIDFSAFLTGIGHAIPFDDKVTQTITLKASGAATYTDEG
jgi:predicted secreted protein